MAKNKFKSPSELADFLKQTLEENADLIKSRYKDNIEYELDNLYEDEADANYEDSYEDSSC